MESERTVGGVMHKGVIGCKPSTPLEEVVRMMADTNLRVLVVTGPDDEALGIINPLDVINYYGKDLKGMKARDVMSGMVIAVPPEMPLAEAVQIMVTRKIPYLGVSERRDVGLRDLGRLSTTDVIREMRGSKWMWYFSPEP
ncbi:MAG: CBS domain-containing protein [Anaerolineae bacterium]|nr:CBS domain-containing protein [Anaerolineae bacterium]